MQILKPMLCAKLKNPTQLQFPVLCTPKLDGIRCLKVNGRVLTRAFKLVPNAYIRECIAQLPDGVDGELVTDDFYSTQSAVMSIDGKPNFKFCMFDLAFNAPYVERVKMLSNCWPHFVQPIFPQLTENIDQFYAFEERALNRGHEGVVARSLGGPYKFGRSTLREGYMVKWKRAEVHEATVLALTEANENCNPVTYNAFGYARRPGGSDLKLPKDTLGAFEVRDVETGVEFSIGTGLGLTAALRDRIWQNQTEYIGKTIRYKHQGTGTLGRPRFPVFLGFRDNTDMELT